MEFSQNILSRFHPLISRWFGEKIGRPTDIQERAWPKIADGEHLLITAPTGSGKTLTAFLWAINQLVTGKWIPGHTSVLYVSPLKALNNDIQRNLIRPLEDLRQAFKSSNEPFPDIRVRTRSGDTPQADRRRMLRHPPEILITTPESLNLLLSAISGRQMLTGLATVILDEIHAVVGTKRGTHLITAVDRLVPLSGEFQRISLSATVQPLSAVAEFIGGFIDTGEHHNDKPHLDLSHREGRRRDGHHLPRYTPRPVSIVESALSKFYAFNIRCAEDDEPHPPDDPVWHPLARDIKNRIEKNRSTLVFTNSRRLCENITYRLNVDEAHPIAYAHHGSLSREIRTEVEQKLKAGELKAIVATNSLEMGIDIGELDEVILVQSPFAISSAIQRVGRAGHQVGQVSRGTLYPTHSHDFLYAAVLAGGVLHQDIEAIEPVQCPLDVLAQVLVSMTGVETWDMDELFLMLRTSYPYRNLSREQYDLVLDMLAGRYEDSRIRELKSRVSIDKLKNTITAKKGALLAVYMAGGTIPNRGYYKLRHQEDGAVIGELDEEFVWEAKTGDLFTFGTQNWKIHRITHNDVFAVPARSAGVDAPFWKNEGFRRDFHFSSRISVFLEHANERLDDLEFISELQHECGMDSPSIHRLIDFLKRQKNHTRCDLPHRHHLLLEVVRSGPDGVPGNQLVLHTLWGGRVNLPLAMALEAAWEERFTQRLEIFSGNDAIVLHLPHEVEEEDILTLVTATTVESLIKKRLEGSGFFGARFRECAGRSLLITANSIHERMPLWMNRLRAQKLLNRVQRYADFPILLEAWRTCLQDEFDLENLKSILDELASGSISTSVTATMTPSPFARGISWNQINEFMYRNDQPLGRDRSNLKESLFEEVVFSPDFRPAVSNDIVNQFERIKQRLSPGYAPQTPMDLIDWTKDRLFIPLPEWEALLQAMKQELKDGFTAVMSQVYEKIAFLSPKRADKPLVTALERVPFLLETFYPDSPDVQVESAAAKKEDGFPLSFQGRSVKKNQSEADDHSERFSSFLGEFLQYYGPRSGTFLQSTLGLSASSVETALEDLLDSNTIIKGRLVIDGNDDDICDSENFEILLRLKRTAAVPRFDPLPVEQLPCFLAHYQGLTRPCESMDDLFQRIEQLLCLPVPARMWEAEIFPARLSAYDPSWMDTIIREGNLRWIGYEKQKTAFCFEPDLDMIREEHEAKEEKPEVNRENTPMADLIPNATGRYDFGTLLRLSRRGSSDLSKQLWQSVWEGNVTNDTFTALRRGIEHRFTVSGMEDSAGGSGRRYSRRSKGRFTAWKQSAPFSGNWFKIPYPESNGDLIEIEERKKERVRLLFDRYGILFRELLAKELPAFGWPNVFRSLRLMELSGEILSGYFFKGIPGPQFISQDALRMLQSGIPEEMIYWLNAADPASLCGLQMDALKGLLPKRAATTHLVYRGAQLVMVSERNGKSLTIHVPSDSPDLKDYLAVLHHLLNRNFQPLRQITVEMINTENAALSPYVEPLRNHFDVLVEFKSITLYRKIT